MAEKNPSKCEFFIYIKSGDVFLKRIKGARVQSPF